MPKYGIGIYVFDAEHRLYLVLKEDSEFSMGSTWVVPGTTFGCPWEDLTEEEQNEMLKSVLDQETPVRWEERTFRNIQFIPLGYWTHYQDNRAFRFENFVVNFTEAFRGLPDQGRVQTGEITGRSFHTLELPVARMADLTKEFFRSSLFHSYRNVPSPAKEQTRSEFAKQLGDESKKYFLFDELRGGGYGLVYRVLDIATLLPRVIKVPLEKAGDETRLERFLIEGKALLTLIHRKVENIEEILSINRIDDTRYYLLKKFINGSNLQDCLTEIADEQKILSIIATIVKTLKKVHELGIVHRDLKPNNIMIENWRGNAPVTTIIDFGLAKSFRNGVGANRHLTAKGFLTGNAIYQSPVTFNDYRHHTPLDDYYSVLHIFYLLVYKNLFYEQLCDKPYEQVIEIVKTCKEEGSDPFLEEEKFGECTPEDEEDGTRECVQCLREFHRIVREAYSDIYDTNTWQPKDEECVKEQLSAAEAKIVEVFG